MMRTTPCPARSATSRTRLLVCAKTLEALVAEQRDNPSPVLDLQVPLLRLLDSHGTTHLMDKVRSVASSGWEVAMATERLWQSLPKQPGLYMFVWRPEFRFHMGQHDRPDSLSYILYVGQSGRGLSAQTLADRYKDYRKYLSGSPEKLWEPSPVETRQTKLARFLTLRPLEHWCCVVPNSAEVDLLEDQLIKLFNPPLNGPRSPRVRPRPPQPAFAPPST